MKDVVLKSRIRRHSLLIFYILSIVAVTDVHAQFKDYKIKRLTLEDGLSQVTIQDILQDSSGFVWIATQDGLNRFDGEKFKIFKYSSTDSTTISSNQLEKLLEDKSGKIWIGSIGKGLNYYDPDKEIFHRIKLEHSNSTNEIISALQTDGDGAIWATSRISGLHKLTPKDNGIFTQKNYFKNHSLGALKIINSNSFWVGGYNGDVYHYNPEKDAGIEPLPTLKLGSRIWAFHDLGQLLLIGTTNGLFSYNPKSNELDKIELEKQGNHPTKHVTSFLKYEDDTIWIGTGSGLFLYNWKERTVANKIKYSETSANGLSNNTVHSLHRLSLDQILVGTANALNLVDLSEPHFKNISKNQLGKHLLNDNVIFSIFKDGNDLWIGTSDGGLNLIRDTKTYHFREDQNKASSISGNVVRAIVKDAQNQRLWLATTRGLSLIDLKTFDPEHPKFIVFHHNPENPNSINDDFLKDLVLDKNNNLWGATYGKGLFRLQMSDGKSVQIVRYANDRTNANTLINDFVHCIDIDKNNDIWAGTEGGLSHIRFDNGNYNGPIFNNFIEAVDTPKSLSNNSIYDLLFDSDEQLWIATNNGLNKFLGNNEFESWTEQKQFTNAVVYSIQNDIKNSLWLGTNEGMVKFDSKNESFTQYLAQDGIQSNEFDIHAKFRDSEGQIYLGGIGGVTYFLPEDLEKIDEPQPLYFSKLQVKDKEVKVHGTANYLLGESLQKTAELEFKHDQFPFFLQFSSVDYRIHKDVTYAYKLLPTDTEWNVLKDPEIQFLNLPAGDYTLQVNGFSRGKEWNQPPLEMDLEILPPWWDTWWSYLIYLVIAVAFADRFYRFQLSRKLAVAESIRLKEVSELKSSLYTNITHEFRTPLTIILGMTKNLKNELKNKISISDKNSLTMIERNGENLLEMVNEMLDLAKLENQSMDIAWIQSDIIPLIKYLVESFHSLAATKNIALTVYNEEDLVLMDFDSHKISSIISNLLSNALKFTPEKGKIIVHTHVIQMGESTALEVKIKDSGSGIAPEDQVNIFNRFYQVISEGHKNTGGTGIGLALCKDLIELLGGSIKVKSSLGRGTEFCFQLPIHTTAQRDPKQMAPKTEKVSTSEPILEVTENGQSTELPLALLIEDNHDVAHYLKSCLKNKYETIHASDGQIGIETALDRMPDIIICDVMMPRKDGYEVCKTLKNDSRTDHIPIIMLTAKVTTQDRIKGLSQGADAYLTKPFEKAELFTRIEKLILLRKKLIGKLEKNSFSSILKDKVSDPQTKFIQEVVQVILDNLDNTTFGSVHLAMELHLSESQIYRKLKAITEKSTAVFIRSVRLQKAKELIQGTNNTMSEIAYEVGFNDPSWFSRSFKEEFGYPPSEVTK
ncbi:MAG: response regulator [Maribacter sp.]|nr:response regulator [Maribacter sp.]